MVFANAGFRYFEALDGLPWAFLGHLGPILGLSWACRGPVMVHVELVLRHLGPVLGYLGASWARG